MKKSPDSIRSKIVSSCKNSFGFRRGLPRWLLLWLCPPTRVQERPELGDQEKSFSASQCLAKPRSVRGEASKQNSLASCLLNKCRLRRSPHSDHKQNWGRGGTRAGYRGGAQGSAQRKNSAPNEIWCRNLLPSLPGLGVGCFRKHCQALNVSLPRAFGTKSANEK